MFLYLVTCVHRLPVAGCEQLEVYAVASDPSAAQESALELMRKLDYVYRDYVDCVELLASVNTYCAPNMLVLAITYLTHKKGEVMKTYEKDVEEALKDAKDAIEDHPSGTYVWYALGVALIYAVLFVGEAIIRAQENR